MAGWLAQPLGVSGVATCDLRLLSQFLKSLCPLVPLLPLSDLISPFVGKEEEELARRASQEELSFQH